MNYLDIVARQEEMQETGMAMQKESQELQDMKIEFAQSHTSFEDSLALESGTSVNLNLNYHSKDPVVLSMFQTTPDNEVVSIDLTIEDFNQIGGFLQKHNDVIFSYMSEINKTDDTPEEA